jgi:hypothetical protein
MKRIWGKPENSIERPKKKKKRSWRQSLKNRRGSCRRWNNQGGGVTVKGYKVSFRADENVLKLMILMDAYLVNIVKAILCFKW